MVSVSVSVSTVLKGVPNTDADADVGVVLALSFDDQAAQANVGAATPVVLNVKAVLIVAVAATDALESPKTRAELSDGALTHGVGSSPLYVVVKAFPAESVAVNVYISSAVAAAVSIWAAVGVITLLVLV